MFTCKYSLYIDNLFWCETTADCIQCSIRVCNVHVYRVCTVHVYRVCNVYVYRVCNVYVYRVCNVHV